MSGRLSELTQKTKRLFERRWSRLERFLLVPCVLLLIASALVAERVRMRHFVMPGVMVEGRDVSGYSRVALDAELRERELRLRQHVVRVRVQDAEFRFSGEDVGVVLPRERAIAHALGSGRRGSIVSQVAWRFRRLAEPELVPCAAELNEAAWKDQLSALEHAVLEIPREGGLRFDGANVERIDPRAGQQIDVEAATARVLAALEAGDTGAIDLSLRERIPETTIEAVTAVWSHAKTLLSAPVVLEARPLPPELAAVATLLGEGEANVKLSPKALAKALAVRQRADAPAELELTLRPEALEDLFEPVLERWEHPSRDARFVVDARHSISIEPSVLGCRADLDALAREVLLKETANAHRAGVTLFPATPPRISTELAGTLGIRGLVSQFVTFYPCCRPRVHNIHHIADLVSGTVVLPGETFSLNGLVGPRTAQSGFRPGPTIVHGEMEDTFGGGISQFTTTLFNAVLDGGYEIVERQPHTFYFDRYPVGHEATLSFPKPDFIFRNDTRFGVLLVAEYGSTHIRIKVYGDNEGRRTTRKVSARFDFKEPPTEYLADPEIVPGENEVEEPGSIGFSVNVTRRITFADGKTSEQARKVTYEPRPRVLRVHVCDIPEGAEGHTGEACPETVIVLDAGTGTPIDVP